VESLIFLIPLVIYVAIIWGSVQIANSKGRSAVLWGILAAVFGLIPLIIVAILPPSETSS
jgi:membrane associated rhomboid family serine protease